MKGLAAQFDSCGVDSLGLCPTTAMNSSLTGVPIKLQFLGWRVFRLMAKSDSTTVVRNLRACCPVKLHYCGEIFWPVTQSDSPTVVKNLLARDSFTLHYHSETPVMKRLAAQSNSTAAVRNLLATFLFACGPIKLHCCDGECPLPQWRVWLAAQLTLFFV